MLICISSHKILSNYSSLSSQMLNTGLLLCLSLWEHSLIYFAVVIEPVICLPPLVDEMYLALVRCVWYTTHFVCL
jgi:hypothetical protein